MLRELSAAFEQTGHEQRACVTVAQNHPRTRTRRNHVDAASYLIVGRRQCLPGLRPWLDRELGHSTSLRNVRIVDRAAASRPITHLRPQLTAAARADHVCQVEDGTIERPDREIVA